MSRGQTHGTCEADVKSIQVGAFAAHVSRFKHEANVAPAAAADFGIAEGVVDDPLVDRAGLVDVCSRACRGLNCGLFHDAVGGNVAGGLQEVLQFGRRKRVGRRGLRQIHGVVLEGDAAGQREQRPLIRGKGGGHDPKSAGLVLGHLCRASFGVEAIGNCLLEWRVMDQSGREPDVSWSSGLQYFNSGNHFEGSPATRRCSMRKRGRGFCESHTGTDDSGRLQEISPIHSSPLKKWNFR